MSWHTIDKNEFYLNASWDIYSPDAVSATGNRCDGNFYGYSGWFDDNGIHSGLADFAIPCGDSATDPLYDWSPLVAPDAWRFIHEARNR